MKRCKICGSIFNPRQDNQLYCSKKCARLGKIIDVIAKGLAKTKIGKILYEREQKEKEQKKRESQAALFGGAMDSFKRNKK